MTAGYGYGQYVDLVPGMDVYDINGEKVGTVRAATDETMTVEKGFFFPKDYIIPLSAVEGVDEHDRVYLRVTKDDALSERWDTAVTSNTYDVATTAAGRATTGVGTTTEAEAARVPVYEEELTAVKRPVRRGVVRIQKELVTENKTVTVPVTEERVRVTRVDTDAPVGADTTGAFEEGVIEGVIEVPLTGEEVELQKTARKTSEVLVEKEGVQQTKDVSGTVRREEVHVDDTTVSDDALKRGTRGN